MAAGEDQAELVVTHDAVGRGHRLTGERVHRGGLLPRSLRLAAQAVEAAVAGDDRQPGARVVGDAAAGPVLERGHGRVLHGVLGEIEPTEGPGEGGEHAPALDPDHLGQWIS